MQAPHLCIDRDKSRSLGFSIQEELVRQYSHFYPMIPTKETDLLMLDGGDGRAGDPARLAEARGQL